MTAFDAKILKVFFAAESLAMSTDIINEAVIRLSPGELYPLFQAVKDAQEAMKSPTEQLIEALPVIADMSKSLVR